MHKKIVVSFFAWLGIRKEWMKYWFLILDFSGQMIYIHMYIVYAYEKKDLADIFYDWLLFFGGYVYVFHFCTWRTILLGTPFSFFWPHKLFLSSVFSFLTSLILWGRSSTVCIWAGGGLIWLAGANYSSSTSSSFSPLFLLLQPLPPPLFPLNIISSPLLIIMNYLLVCFSLHA